MPRSVLFLAVLVLLLAACSGGGATPAAVSDGDVASGDVASGEALFKKTVFGARPGCVTCHSLAGNVLVGPPLNGVADRAGAEVPGQPAEAYLKASILAPDAHVVTGFEPGVMQSYEEVLAPQQIADLVAYLLTLK